MTFLTSIFAHSQKSFHRRTKTIVSFPEHINTHLLVSDVSDIYIPKSLFFEFQKILSLRLYH